MKNLRDIHRKTAPETALPAARWLIYESPPAFKQYERFPSISLPAPEPIADSLSSLLSKRETRYDYGDYTMSLQALSDTLFWTAGINGSQPEGVMPTGVGKPSARRHHPSGGGLYPLEYYIAPRRVESLSDAIYHYAPQKHALECILTGGTAHDAFESSAGLVPSQNPAAIVIITSAWGRNYPKYGDYAYRLSLLEAGHAAHSLVLAATARNLKSGTIGGFREKELSRALDLCEEDAEDLLYTIFLGS